uniref:Glutathione transferase n=1 Tax=Macrostomum lignano TaxID=282301 RepID=A0A1I8FCK2_9PLAT
MSNQQQPANIIFESSKHLESGEPEPQLKPNLLTLYSMRFCPFAQRTRLVLQHKQLPHQIVNLNLVRKPDWFLAKTRTPEPPLYPGDARKRAAMRLAVGKMGDSVIPAFYRWAMRRGDEQKAEWESLLAGLTQLQAQLGDSNFFGDCDGANGRPDDLALDRAAAGRRKDAGLPAARGQYRQALKAGTGSSRGKNVLMETAKHLESGEPEPQLKPNLLTLYSMRFCPAHRLVLQHKQLPHQIVNLNLVRKPDWFLAKSASGKVPALLEPDGSVLEDSLVTSRHLEETHRESALYPSNADKRAQMDGVIAQMGEKVIPAFYRLFGVSGDEKKAAFEQLVTELESMQSTLGDSNFSPMADLMIWPWFERLKPSCSLAGFQVPEERLKSLMSWMGRMEQQRAVLETRNTDEA